MTLAMAYVDVDVAVMSSAGDPAVRGMHEVRGSIFVEALDGA